MRRKRIPTTNGMGAQQKVSKDGGRTGIKICCKEELKKVRKCINRGVIKGDRRAIPATRKDKGEMLLPECKRKVH